MVRPVSLQFHLLISGAALVLPLADAVGEEGSGNRPTRGASHTINSRVHPLDAMRSRRDTSYYEPAPATGAAVSKSVSSPTKPPAAPTRTAPVVPRVYSPARTTTSSGRRLDTRYPVKMGVVATIFWIGEKPSGANKTPNHKSSWDTEWMKNYGGYDDPNPANRIDFRPKRFVPKLNPFYVALPYNDRASFNRTKPEAPRVIPWFKKKFVRQGQTVCKGRWVAIRYRDRICFAQWEDCGPFETDDWRYVFGNARPKNRKNRGAGIDLSPSVRDYLGIKSGQRCDWRFVDLDQVPWGPWRKYGNHDEFVQAKEAETEKLRRAREAWLRSQQG